MVRNIRDNFGLTVLLIEHDMRFVMSLCEEIVVLYHGEEIARGNPDEIRNNPKVIAAYLGEPA
jgi:branched-chain amino acid transport system ATP-binding protein